jgi:hypothetical protein
MAARIEKWIADMNKSMAVVMPGGKARVMVEQFDEVFRRWRYDFATFRDIRDYYGDRLVGRGEHADTLGNAWLKHHQHRKYRDVIFAPDGKVPEGYFNLWRGWAVQPKPGDWNLYEEHLFENVCQNDIEQLEYVKGWMATVIQHPARPAEVALVLRGRQGTGKGVTAREFGSLFGPHFLHISNIKHLTGNFNSHLRDTLLLFADEVFCTGRKQDESEMKRLITEPTLTIEAKYKDVTVARNMLHVIIASNDRWIVPAGPFERRFCVLDVGDAHMQDGPYFNAITEQMRDGGRQALLHDLLHHDLSNFEIRKVPATRALQDQKLMSMKAPERWWYEKLRDGQLLPTHRRWETEILREALCQNYAEAMTDAGARANGWGPSIAVGMLLERMLNGSLHDSRRMYGGARVRYWHFPPLAEARDLFDKAMGQIRPWPEETR